MSTGTGPTSNLTPIKIDLIQDLFQKIIGPFAGTQVGPLLLEPDNIEERVQLLIETFDAHPNLITPFRTLVKSLSKGGDSVVPIEEQIRFYTTKHTREWLIVNLLNQVLDLKELRLDEATGRLPAETDDLLQFAVRARIAVGEESRYRHYAFAAGLYFDFLNYLQKTPILDLGGQKFDDAIETGLAKAIEQGKLIVQLSKHKSKLSLEKYAPFTAYLRQLSQVSLMLLRPDTAKDFYQKMSELNPTEPLRLTLEMKTFGAHCGIIGAYIGQSLPLFEQLGESMSIWGFPYLGWISHHKDVHDLSGMGELGVVMHERLKASAFPGSLQASAAVPELKYLDFKVTPGVKNETKI